MSGVDLLERRPLLDIKPYVRALDHLAAERTGWLGTAISQRAGDTINRL